MGITWNPVRSRKYGNSLDWPKAAEMALTGHSCAQISGALGYSGRPKQFRRMLRIRGIEIRPGAGNTLHRVDWDHVAALAADGLLAGEIKARLNYTGDVRGIRDGARKRGITLRTMDDSERARLGGEASAKRSRGVKLIRQPPRAAPAWTPPEPRPVRNQEPDREARPMYADRTAEAVATMRARGATGQQIAQALRLTPRQAAEFGIKPARVADTFGNDPRGKKARK